MEKEITLSEVMQKIYDMRQRRGIIVTEKNYMQSEKDYIAKHRSTYV